MFAGWADELARREQEPEAAGTEADTRVAEPAAPSLPTMDMTGGHATGLTAGTVPFVGPKTPQDIARWRKQGRIRSDPAHVLFVAGETTIER